MYLFCKTFLLLPFLLAQVWGFSAISRACLMRRASEFEERLLNVKEGYLEDGCIHPKVFPGEISAPMLL